MTKKAKISRKLQMTFMIRVSDNSHAFANNMSLLTYYTWPLL